MQTSKRKIPLSMRMKSILEMLQQESREHGPIPCVADVGCDHAFVSMACVEEKIADHVIAMDVRKGPLAIAQAHILEYGFEKRVETRISDGLEGLQVGEASWAVLAGMGGALMQKILKQGKKHLDVGISLVLQPQSELPELRLYLEQQNYIITDEDFLQEDGKFYTIIKAIKNEKGGEKTSRNQVELQYGPVLLRKDNSMYWEYLNEEKHKMQELQKRLQKQNTEASRRRCEELRGKLQLLDEARKYSCQ